MKQFTCSMGALIATASLLSLPGCAAPPTHEEMARDYRLGRSLALETLDGMRERCRQDFAEGSQELTTCLQTAHDWYRTHMQEINLIYRKALDGKWNEVRERRERLERELLEMLPNFEELKDLFEQIQLQGSMTGTGSGLHRNTFFPSSPVSPIGNPVPIEVETYNFAGSFLFTRGGVSEPATIGGELDLHISQNGLQSSGKIASGLLTATFSNSETLQMVVIKKSGNTFSTDANGNGSISFWVDVEHSLEEWDSILFDQNLLTFELQIDASGQMTLSPPPPSPHRPMPHSDYNGDGNLNYNSDFGAYLVGHAANQDEADINADGVWDQEDIDLWIGDFLYDEGQL